MLYVFGFERTAVVLGDLYFVDPDPKNRAETIASTTSQIFSGKRATSRLPGPASSWCCSGPPLC